MTRAVRPRVVVFDLDGTLVDSMPLVFAAISHALEPFGARTQDEIFARLGGPPDRFLAALLDDLKHVPAARQRLDAYDRYYLDRRRGRPLPVVLVRLGDRGASRFYIDPKTARLVGVYHARNWVTRWLYHGLHSLDFPWLYRYRPLWDVIVGGFMLGGTALCCTSLVLAWQVLARTLSRRLTPANQIRRDAREGRPLQ